MLTWHPFLLKRRTRHTDTLLYKRRRKLKADRKYEIAHVTHALISQGAHPRVSPIVARWFRRQNCVISKNTNSKYYNVVIRTPTHRAQ